MQVKEDRLSRLAGGMQEACWLAAACVVPLLFNPRGGDLAFQPLKFGVWAILSVIGVAAWIVRRVSLGSSGRSLGVNGLLYTLSFIGLATLLTVCLSVDRVASVWGTPETFQGIVIIFASLSMTALVACNLRTNVQLQRLAGVMIMAGFAAALLAILQRLGLDPQYPDLLGARCQSTAGHPIYLGGYLLMTIALTIWRLLESWSRPGGSGWIGRGLVTLILVGQVVGFVCAESRGPTIGLGTMLLAFSIFLAVHHRRRDWLAGILTVCAFGAISLSVISSGTLSRDFGSNVPILKRFIKTKGFGDGFEFYRAQTWEHMPRMMAPERALPFPSGESDKLHSLRFLVGYGPETLPAVLPQERAWRGSDRVENRFHNLVWDQLFSFGALGMAGLFTLLFLTFGRGFQLLGWMVDRPSVVKFVSILGAASLAGAAAAGMAISPGFIGMGIIGGLVAGIMIFAITRITCPSTKEEPDFAVASSFVLVIALLSALAGHLADMAFAFPTAPTAVMFCLVLGMVHAADRVRRNHAKARVPTLEEIISRPPPIKATAFVANDVAILALGVITILFGLIHQYSYDPMSVGGILKWSLFNPKPEDGRSSFLIVVPLALLSVMGCFLATGGKGAGFYAKRVIFLVLPAGLIGVVYAIFQTFWIAQIGAVPSVGTSLPEVVGQAAAYEHLFTLYLVSAGALLALTTWDLARPFPAGNPIRSSVWIAAGVTGVVTFALSLQFILRPLKANFSSQWGAALEALQRPEFAKEIFRRAVRIDPRPFAYRGLLASSLMNSANRSQDVEVARTLLAESEKILIEGRSISEFNRSHFYLGQVYLQQALGESNPARDATAARSARAFAMAAKYEPNQEQIWTYASIVDRLLLGNSVAADLKLAHAIQLKAYAPDVAAANYGGLGASAPDSRLRAEFARIAAIHYDHLIAISDRQGVAEAKFQKAKLLQINHGDSSAIENLLREAIPDAPVGISWQVNGMLAEILIKKRDFPGACVFLKKALQTAPENMRRPINEMLKQLGGPP